MALANQLGTGARASYIRSGSKFVGYLKKLHGLLSARPSWGKGHTGHPRADLQPDPQLAETHRSGAVPDMFDLSRDLGRVILSIKADGNVAQFTAWPWLFAVPVNLRPSQSVQGLQALLMVGGSNL
jgi:hypothetical protein